MGGVDGEPEPENGIVDAEIGDQLFGLLEGCIVLSRDSIGNGQFAGFVFEDVETGGADAVKVAVFRQDERLRGEGAGRRQ